MADVVRYDSALEWCAKARMLCWGGAVVVVGEEVRSAWSLDKARCLGIVGILAWKAAIGATQQGEGFSPTEVMKRLGQV